MKQFLLERGRAFRFGVLGASMCLALTAAGQSVQPSWYISGNAVITGIGSNAQGNYDIFTAKWRLPTGDYANCQFVWGIVTGTSGNDAGLRMDVLTVQNAIAEVFVGGYSFNPSASSGLDAYVRHYYEQP